MRDLYERGAEIKGDTLIIPAEEYQVPDERDHIRVISISHAFEKIRDPKIAVEFHSLARVIAGETADIGTEIEVFKHYYDQIERDAERRRLDRHGEDYERERAASLDRTLAVAADRYEAVTGSVASWGGGLNTHDARKVLPVKVKIVPRETQAGSGAHAPPTPPTTGSGH